MEAAEVVVVVAVAVAAAARHLSGDSQLSTILTSCLPLVGNVLSGPSFTVSSHCVRYQNDAAFGKPHRSYWP